MAHTCDKLWLCAIITYGVLVLLFVKVNYVRLKAKGKGKEISMKQLCQVPSEMTLWQDSHQLQMLQACLLLTKICPP